MSNQRRLRKKIEKAQAPPDLDEWMQCIYKLQQIKPSFETDTLQGGRDTSDQWQEHSEIWCFDCGMPVDECECGNTDTGGPRCEFCGDLHLPAECAARALAMGERPSTPATSRDWEKRADEIVTITSAKVSEQAARRMRAELALAKSQVEAGHLTGHDALARIEASSQEVIAKSPK